MNWFEGNIEQAITLSKSKQSIFVVYIEGNALNASKSLETQKKLFLLCHDFQ
jgi:hypothetical protein